MIFESVGLQEVMPNPDRETSYDAKTISNQLLDFLHGLLISWKLHHAKINQ